MEVTACFTETGASCTVEVSSDATVLELTQHALRALFPRPEERVGEDDVFLRLTGSSGPIGALSAPIASTALQGGEVVEVVKRELHITAPFVYAGTAGAAALALSPSGRLVAARHRSTLSLHCTETGKLLWEVAARTPTSFFCVAVSWCGLYVAAASARSVVLHRASNGGVWQRLSGHEGTVSAVCFSRCGTRIVSGSEDHTLRVYSLPDGVCERAIDAQSPIGCVALSPDGLVSSSAQGLQVWSLTTGECVRTLPPCTSFCLMAPGLCAASCSDPPELRVWCLATGECRLVLSCDSIPDSVTAASCGKICASRAAYSDDPALHWDLASGERVGVDETLIDATPATGNIALTSCGQWLFQCTSRGVTVSRVQQPKDQGS